jgi:hypothetical protein
LAGKQLAFDSERCQAMLTVDTTLDCPIVAGLAVEKRSAVWLARERARSRLDRSGAFKLASHDANGFWIGCRLQGD